MRKILKDLFSLNREGIGKNRFASLTIFCCILIYSTNIQAHNKFSIEISSSKKELQNQITGNVTDSEGNPLPGANIVEKGTSNGTQTDFDGNFSIEVNEDATLQISYIGFASQEIPLNGRTNLSIILKEDAAGLDEVVLVGYGTTRKSDLTGAISTVKSEDLNTFTNASVEQSLIAQAAGLSITSASGQPGAGVDIVIRGATNVQTNINGQIVGASNAPLYVLDGFPVTGGVETQDIGQFGNSGPRSPLNDINPNDIASIEVLKDASATAIYGSRAANGVILITTKRGNKGKLKVDYSANYTSQTVSKWLDLMDATQYMTERNEVLRDASGDPENFVPPYSASDIANAGPGTDWFDAITRTGFIHQQNIAVSGGNENTRVLSSLNYFNQEGVVKNSDLKRFIGRLNLDQRINDHISFGLSFTASTVNNGNVPLGGGFNEDAPPLRSAIDFSPLVPIRDENGDFSRHPINVFSSTMANPVSLLDIEDETVTDRLFANAFVDIQIVKGLNAKVKVGIDKRSSTRNFFSPTTNIFGASDKGKAIKTYNKKNDELFGGTLTYNKLFGKQNLTVLAGYEYQQFNAEGFSGQNNNFITDGLLYNDLNSGIGNPTVGSYKSIDELASYFGRVNYIYNGKYLLTASVRTDGSPRFGANNRWGVFPSAAFAWRVSNEEFMTDQEIVSNLKVRVGYGQTGNNSISGATALYETRGNYIYGLGSGQGPQFGVQQTRYANPDLKWQTNTEFNAGLDFGFFNNKLSGSIDYFNKEVSNLLGSRQLKTYLPISQIGYNIGATKSTGVEVVLQSKNFTGAFSWNTNINFSTYDDRWKERDPNGIYQPYESNTDRLGSVWIYDYVGIQQIGDPIPEHQPNIKPGQPIVRDINGVDNEGNLVSGPDGQITPADKIYIGTTAPGFTYGIINELKYKGFDFSFVLQGMGDRLRRNDTRGYYLLRASSVQEGRNALAEFTERWTPTNTDATIPSGTVNSTPGAADRLFWEDAGFLRLRNATLGYTFPSYLFGAAISKARIFVDAQNIFINTDYTGIDPEYDSIGAYPNQRSYTLGLNISF